MLLANKNNKTTRPLTKQQRQQVNALRQKRVIVFQLWLLFIMIMTVAVIDAIFWQSQYVITKSITAGAMLNWLAQALFIWCVFRYSGYQARRHIVNQLYVGQMLKWLVILVGFVTIFLTIKPLSALAVFLGFMLIQISQTWLLWRIN